jgi:phage shock protein E
MHADLEKRASLIALATGMAALGWWAVADMRRRNAVLNVDLAEAKRLIDAGALVLDVRSRGAFDHRHVPPAMLVPLAVLEAGIPSSLAHARELPIVVYCNDGHRSGPQAAAILGENGFRNVVNMKSGIEGWSAAGLPLASGAR